MAECSYTIVKALTARPIWRSCWIGAENATNVTGGNRPRERRYYRLCPYFVVCEERMRSVG
jgi:hypothetical protein